MTKELSGKPLHNVHKLVYLANEYTAKTKDISEVAALMQLAMLDINVAIWRAVDVGYLVINDNQFSVDRVPEEWQFGPEVEELMETITYAFKRLARDEQDVEENFFGNWTNTYPTHDVIIAVKKLIADKVLTTYEIRDTVVIKKGTRTRNEVTKENVYIFYTLYENMEMRWGTKQFRSTDKLK